MIREPTIGERGQRFTLEVPIETPDGFGGVLRTYQAGPQIWGAMEMVGEAERLRAGRAEGIATHRVTFRYREDVTSEARLGLGLRHFRIKATADPDGRKRSLVCLVEEIRP